MSTTEQIPFPHPASVSGPSLRVVSLDPCNLCDLVHSWGRPLWLPAQWGSPTLWPYRALCLQNTHHNMPSEVRGPVWLCHKHTTPLYTVWFRKSEHISVWLITVSSEHGSESVFTVKNVLNEWMNGFNFRMNVLMIPIIYQECSICQML